MTVKWRQPQEMKLAERLQDVVAGLREATPLLLETQTNAFKAMAATIQLASQTHAMKEHHE